MDAIRKPLGYLLCALGLIEAAWFIAFPFYFRYGDVDLAFEIWRNIDIVMAVGGVIALVIAFLRWRVYDRSDLREAVATGAMFMFAGAFVLMLFEQWLSASLLVPEGETVGEFRNLVWIAIDVSFPVLMGWVGSWLVRSE